MHLEGISEDAIAELNIPTGAPRRYSFDGSMKVTSADYLGDAAAVAAAAAAVSKQAGACTSVGATCARRLTDVSADSDP
jgi:2,3-bisphosphoglycerate-dependent phosphoglycerate mutase